MLIKTGKYSVIDVGGNKMTDLEQQRLDILANAILNTMIKLKADWRELKNTMGMLQHDIEKLPNNMLVRDYSDFSLYDSFKTKKLKITNEEISFCLNCSRKNNCNSFKINIQKIELRYLKNRLRACRVNKRYVNKSQYEGILRGC